MNKTWSCPNSHGLFYSIKLTNQRNRLQFSQKGSNCSRVSIGLGAVGFVIYCIGIYEHITMFLLWGIHSIHSPSAVVSEGLRLQWLLLCSIRFDLWVSMFGWMNSATYWNSPQRPAEALPAPKAKQRPKWAMPVSVSTCFWKTPEPEWLNWIPLIHKEDGFHIWAFPYGFCSCLND